MYDVRVNARPTFRLATPAERSALEELQRRASLIWEEDRDALLAHPDAIELPLEQITDGRTIVAESVGELLGFAVVLPREDGDAELDGTGGTASAARWSTRSSAWPARRVLRAFG